MSSLREDVLGHHVDAGKIFRIARQAPSWLPKSSDGNRIEREGVAFGAVQGDVELTADRVLGARFRDAFSDPSFSAECVSVEGLGEHRPEHPHLAAHSLGRGLWYCVDPIDGSLNYLMRNGALGLPYASCVTVLRRKDAARFSDVLTAVIVDLRSGDHWSVRPMSEGSMTCLNDAPISLKGPDRLDLGRQIVIGEMYYPENRAKIERAFAGKKGWLRNPGSAAYEMALVASGTAVAYICDRQKQHELGAGYALVKGAGGVAVDWDGQDLGPRAYDFASQTPVILAANRAIADQVLELLRKAGEG
mgnify:FL=1